MTVIQPNSVAGINSITVQSGNSLAVHKANGELIRTITSNSGVSTFSSISVGTAATTNSAGKSINIGLGASISQHDANTLSFGTNGDERLKIESNGDVTLTNTSSNPQLAIISAANGIGEIQFGDTADSVRGNILYRSGSAGDALCFNGYNNTERLRITSAGSIGINSTSPDRRFTLYQDATTRMNLKSLANSTTGIEFGDPADHNIGYIVYDNTDDSMQFGVNAGEKVRIDSSGRVLVGHTGSLSEGTGFQVVNTSDNTAEFFAYVASTSGSRLTLTKSRSGTKGTNTVVQSGDKLGEIHFRGADGTGYIRGATISAEVDGTPGTNDMPGRLVFSTTADGANSQTERLRIDSSGRLLIGHTAAHSVGGGNSLLQIQATNATGRLSVVQHRNEAGGSPFISLGKSRGTSNGSTTILQSGDEIGTLTWAGADGNDLDNQACCITGAVDGTPGSNDMPGRLEFRTTADGASSATERLRIDSAGAIRFGATAAIQSEKFTFFRPESEQNTLAYFHSGASSDVTGVLFRHGRALSGYNGKQIGFLRSDGTEVGSIISGASSTSFNTSSDYRLKENAVSISDGITRLKTLKPYRFNFKEEPSVTVDGFFAHEVTAVPEAIAGTKDAVDSDNKPVYQGIDQAKLVPLLTAALQEAITKIETLETKVAALEGG
jgi:hypothetical protein